MTAFRRSNSTDLHEIADGIGATSIVCQRLALTLVTTSPTSPASPRAAARTAAGGRVKATARGAQFWGTIDKKPRGISIWQNPDADRYRPK
jgi:hypothetical protein